MTSNSSHNGEDTSCQNTNFNISDMNIFAPTLTQPSGIISDENVFLHQNENNNDINTTNNENEKNDGNSKKCEGHDESVANKNDNNNNADDDHDNDDDDDVSDGDSDNENQRREPESLVIYLLARTVEFTISSATGPIPLATLLRACATIGIVDRAWISPNATQLPAHQTHQEQEQEQEQTSNENEKEDKEGNEHEQINQEPSEAAPALASPSPSTIAAIVAFRHPSSAPAAIVQMRGRSLYSDGCHIMEIVMASAASVDKIVSDGETFDEEKRQALNIKTSTGGKPRSKKAEKPIGDTQVFEGEVVQTKPIESKSKRRSRRKVRSRARATAINQMMFAAAQAHFAATGSFPYSLNSFQDYSNNNNNNNVTTLRADAPAFHVGGYAQNAGMLPTTTLRVDAPSFQFVGSTHNNNNYNDNIGRRQNSGTVSNNSGSNSSSLRPSAPSYLPPPPPPVTNQNVIQQQPQFLPIPPAFPSTIHQQQLPMPLHPPEVPQPQLSLQPQQLPPGTVMARDLNGNMVLIKLADVQHVALPQQPQPQPMVMLPNHIYPAFPPQQQHQQQQQVAIMQPFHVQPQLQQHHHQQVAVMPQYALQPHQQQQQYFVSSSLPPLQQQQQMFVQYQQPVVLPQQQQQQPPIFVSNGGAPHYVSFLN